MALVTLVGVAVGAATFLYAKKKKTTNGTAAVAGVATGAGSAALTGLAIWALPYAFVGAAAYGVYSLVKGEDEPKALPPGRS